MYICNIHLPILPISLRTGMQQEKAQLHTKLHTKSTFNYIKELDLMWLIVQIIGHSMNMRLYIVSNNDTICHLTKICS